MRLDTSTAVAAAAMGVLAGMRGLAAPATVAQRLSNDGITNQAPVALRAFGSRRTARALKALAVGELAADKLPFVPDRTSVPSLLFRIASGAACGAALATWRRESTMLGALIGGAAAAGASYGFLAARKAAQRAGVPYPVSGLAEDALVGAGYWAAQRALG